MNKLKNAREKNNCGNMENIEYSEMFQSLLFAEENRYYGDINFWEPQ